MNNIILTGRLTKDVEMRYIPVTGTPVATFTLAVDRDFVKKDGTRDTDFIPVETIGKTAEFCKNYLSKGRLVAVQGSIRVDRYQDKNTQEFRVFTKVSARTVQALDKKPSTNNTSSNTSNNKSAKEQELDKKLLEIADSDIPF